MKKLELIFKSSDDKTKTFTLNYAAGDLTAEKVTAQMDAIAALKLFDKNGVNPYATALAARYVETTASPLFDRREVKQADAK